MKEIQLQLSKFNLYDLNFILCFSGFTIFTTFVDSSIGSVIYRAAALFIAIIGLIKCGFRLTNKGIYVKWFLAIFILFLLKISFCLLLEDVSSDYEKSRINVFLFGYGIVLIPLLCYVSSYDKVHGKMCLWIIFGALFCILLQGILQNEMTYYGGVERVNLNNRQSTLAFGDNGAYLIIASLALLCRAGKHKFPKWTIVLLVLGILIGVQSIGKAASRGPLVSALAGILILIIYAPKVIKLITALLVLVAVSYSVVALEYLEDFAPVLYARTMNTIDDNDTSGRDELADEALGEIKESPLLGGNPAILEYDGNFTSYHNCYLDVGVALGFPGLMAYIGLILALLFFSIRRKKQIDSVWGIFMMGMLWFSAVRSITGVFLISNANFCVVIATACIIIGGVTKNKQVNLLK